MPDADDKKAILYNLILDAKRADAVALLDDAIEVDGFDGAISGLLDPVLRTIGERWSLDSISLAQAYVAGKVAEDMLVRLDSSTRSTPPAAHRGIAVLGNAEDDYHALGRRMVATFLRLGGWKVHDLGNDVLPKAFIDVALEEGASVIGVSAMMLTNARNILKIREELDARCLSGRIALAVGGAVFALRPGLVAEVGGDGTALSAVDAPALFDRLAAQKLLTASPMPR